MVNLLLGQKNDNYWPLAYSYGIGSVYYYNMEFTNGYADTVSYQRKMKFYMGNAAISDSSGDLQFYTNGIWIANRQHDTMQYSLNFNPSYSIGGGVASNFMQPAITFPFGDGGSRYYLVHENGEYFFNKDSANDIQPFSLRYTVIDMQGDSGNGAVDTNYKSVVAINDTLLLGRITACKHANGRDCWVVTHQYYSDMYYKLLFTPYGVFGPYTQHIGVFCYPKFAGGLADYDVTGMACFSPDGSKYAMFGADNRIELFDFDRCTGLFSNYITTILPDTVSAGIACSFSPNSRYMYANNYTKAYQYDTYSSNFAASAVDVATFDGYSAPNPAWFFLNQLAPDGRIYISARNFPRILHVIENPDSAGAACNFNQHSFILPQNYGGNMTLPNFPNYRLGRLVGSACDTLTNLTYTPQPPKGGVTVMPNPNTGNFIISYDLPQNTSGTLQIMDVMGKEVYFKTLPQWSTMQRINLSSLSAGVYVVKINNGINAGYARFVKE
ncbi:MAG: T9SS type A sorting domain-containing protein [Chitinophagaceae bacterium]|nr:T9SS type A sorting domain-containing protein [Chitinophagaceae bacterium]